MKKKIHTVWTVEDQKKLVEMWKAGRTAADISRALGKTRSAVLGRAMRSGLSRRPGNNTPRSKQKAGKGEGRVRRPVPVAVPVPAKLYALADMSLRQCRWPYGDPKEDGFGFCGAETTPGSCYCAGHKAQAYVR